MYPYGYINRTEAVDGDQVDVYLGPDESADTVYVVHQRKYGDWAHYDEDKCMLNFPSESAAKAAYLKHYDDPRFLGPITALPVAEFVAKARATKDAPKMIKALFLKGGKGSGNFEHSGRQDIKGGSAQHLRLPPFALAHAARFVLN
jgi:Inorganic Pyrophosphatase